MRTIDDQTFSTQKCVRIARILENSHELLCKLFAAILERTKDELEPWNEVNGIRQWKLQRF